MLRRRETGCSRVRSPISRRQKLPRLSCGKVFKRRHLKVNYMSYRRKPKGWYTKNGKHVPIMSGIGGKRGLPKLGHDVIKYSRPLSYQLPQPEKSLNNFVMNTVLSKAPIISELHTAYVLADSLYENWNTISQFYSSYQTEGWRGVAKLVGSDVIQNPLSSLQTNLVWSAICRFIPAPVQGEGREILSKIVDKVTSTEISFVTKFLTQQKTKTKKGPAAKRKQNYPTQNYLNKKWKIPDDVNYV